MKIEFVGGAKTVTGSSYIIKDDDFTIMVDCGMFQGKEELRNRNSMNLIYAPDKIDVLLLTHAHIDHSGLIPKLIKEGFKGKIYSTKATADLCAIMLPDSAHIQEMDIKWINRRNKKLDRPLVQPLYTVADAEKAIEYFETIPYGEKRQIHPKVHVCFHDAGHILGSAFIEVWVESKGKQKKIVFSGDLGPKGQAIIRDPEIIDDADFLLIESTYGNRLHKSKDDTYQEFKNIILQSINNNGNIIVPAFAIERTQEIIYTLAKMIKNNDIPPIPVYVDSPLAVSATEIFRDNPECFDRETRAMLSFGQSPLDFESLHFVRTTEESKALATMEKGAMIISASGMCTAGRIRYHLRENLYNPHSSVIFVGFQAEGTLGRRIVDGADRVRIDGEDIAVRATIHTLGGFSAHGDQRGLKEWVANINNPNLKVFVVHGEPEAATDFATLLHSAFHIYTHVPNWGEIIDLETMRSEMSPYGASTEDYKPIESEIDSVIRSLETLKKYYRETTRNESSFNENKFKEDIQDIQALISLIHDGL